MFFLRRPSSHDIERFLRVSRDLPMSYQPSGILDRAGIGGRLDEARTVIGHGEAAFARARAALRAWKHFDMGWVDVHPACAPVQAGTVVAVRIRHLGFWSLNGCRVLSVTPDDDTRFGFTYGTLTNHAESGEELFEVSLDPRSGDVTYRIRARSWAQAPLARLGQPIVRTLQQRFRDHSAEVMVRAAG
jgi:uncharacterized protein (UPF0548 family)